jgi:hypothetical protein
MMHHQLSTEDLRDPLTKIDEIKNVYKFFTSTLELTNEGHLPSLLRIPDHPHVVAKNFCSHR